MGKNNLYMSLVFRNVIRCFISYEYKPLNFSIDALKIMSENELNQAELQYIWDKVVGDFDKSEIDKIEELLKKYDMEVSCISRHNFAGIGVHETNIGDKTYTHHMEKLKKCIDMAKRLNSPLVRIMSFRKEMVLFGKHGAEKWNVSDGGWIN